MNHLPDDELKKNDEAKEKKSGGKVSFGGYGTWLEYEDDKSASVRVGKTKLILIVCGISLVSVLALFGLIALINGSLFHSADNQGGNATVLRVPTNDEISAASSTDAFLGKLRDATITVSFFYSDGEEKMQTGFVVSEDGFAVTAAALFLQTPAPIDISAYCGDNGPVKAQLVGTDSVMGLAVIKLQSGGNYTAVSLGNSDYTQVGEAVWAVGDIVNGTYYGCTLSGAVATINKSVSLFNGERFVRTIPVIYTDFAWNETVLGAPLMNANGQVIGFCTDVLEAPYAGMGSVVPVNSLVSVLNDMIRANTASSGVVVN